MCSNKSSRTTDRDGETRLVYNNLLLPIAPFRFRVEAKPDLRKMQRLEDKKDPLLFTIFIALSPARDKTISPERICIYGLSGINRRGILHFFIRSIAYFTAFTLFSLFPLKMRGQKSGKKLPWMREEMRFEYVLHRPRTKNITKCNEVSRLILSIEGVNLFIWLREGKRLTWFVDCRISSYSPMIFPNQRTTNWIQDWEV